MSFEMVDFEEVRKEIINTLPKDLQITAEENPNSVISRLVDSMAISHAKLANRINILANKVLEEKDGR